MFSLCISESVTKAFERAKECGYAHVDLHLLLRILLENQEFLKIMNGFGVDVAKLKDELDTRLACGEKIKESASLSSPSSRPCSTASFRSFMRGLGSKNKSPIPDEPSTRDRYLKNEVPDQTCIEMVDVFHGLCFLKESHDLQFAQLLARFSMTKEAWQKHSTTYSLCTS